MVSEKKTFKDYMILNMYIAKIKLPGDKILIVTKKFYYFNHKLQISAISLKTFEKLNFNIFPIQIHREANLILP